MSDTEEEKVLIGGDFNVKIGQEGKVEWEEEKNNILKQSKDKVKNKEGRQLLEMTEEKGWSILNGNTEGDEKGEWTYVGARGNSVIDYAITNVMARDEIKKFKVEERIESDHMPLKVELIATTERQEKQEEEEWREKRIWTEEGSQKYREQIKTISFEKIEVNEMIEEMIEKLKGSLQERNKDQEMENRKQQIG